MTRAFVDTSGWYAFFDAQQSAHAAVDKHIGEWQGRLVTTDYVFDEILTLALQRLGQDAAVEIGERLLDSANTELVRLMPEDFEDAWETFRRFRDKGWSFTDCTSFAVMRRLRIRAAVAIDRHFHQAGFDVLPG